MPISIQTPTPVDTTKTNPIEFIYLKGDANTDGSLRLKPDITGVKFEFQLRTASVWNDTDIQVASASIFLGKDLRLSSVGEWLETFSVNVTQRALIPHVNFNNFGTFSAHSPVLGVKVIRTPSQTDDSQEFTGLDLQQLTINPSQLIVTKIFFKTGNTIATEPIQVTFRRGSAIGPIFWQMNFPASLMGSANTVFPIDIEGGVSGVPGETIHTQLLSTADISVRGSPAGAFWQEVDFFPQGEEDIILDHLLLAEDASLIFSEDASFVVTKTFPT